MDSELFIPHIVFNVNILSLVGCTLVTAKTNIGPIWKLVSLKMT